MIYSCFDPQSALYDYYQNSLQLPVNADLPVPTLPKATQIGVASIEAGRPLPADARHIGRGWHAKGQVVQCGRGPMGAMGALDLGSTWVGWKWIGAGVAAYAAWRIIR